MALFVGWPVRVFLCFDFLSISHLASLSFCSPNFLLSMLLPWYSVVIVPQKWVNWEGHYEICDLVLFLKAIVSSTSYPLLSIYKTGAVCVCSTVCRVDSVILPSFLNEIMNVINRLRTIAWQCLFYVMLCFLIFFFFLLT